MTWSTDPQVQNELSGYAREVLSIEDQLARCKKALQLIAYCSAYDHPSTYLGTLAMTALYPEDYKNASKG
jgi:hypothetical protein